MCINRKDSFNNVLALFPETGIAFFCHFDKNNFKVLTHCII